MIDKIEAINEKIKIEVDRSKLLAYIIFYEPQNGGEFLKKENIINSLRSEGIKFGIIEENIEKNINLKENKDYLNKIEVAIGKEPINGIDGKLEYTFDITGKQSQPKILDDGTVDYKQMNYFLPVRAGQLLANRIDPVEGKSGTDIFGNPIQYKPGKPAPKFFKGKNVYITEDDMELKSQISGQLVISGKTIGVTAVLDIKGDVGFETGNIDFEGSVNISGNIMSGFSVDAIGNVEVKGVVEAAEINAKGAINLYGGIQGRGKAKIKAGGNIFMKFAENANIESDGNIVANSIIHSLVECRGSIDLQGDNGILIGGSVTAGGEIKAKTIGSIRGTKTEIRAGNNPEIIKKYLTLKNKYKESKENYNKVDKTYKEILKLGSIESFDNKQKRMMVSLINDRNLHRKEIKDLEIKISDILEKIKGMKSRIIAEKSINFGVIAYISDVGMEIDNEINSCILQNIDGKIVSKAIVS